MSQTPTCRACGYTITFPDDPVESVTICPRCNRPLADKASTSSGMLILGIAGLLFVVLLISFVFTTSHLVTTREDEAALKAQNIQKACMAFNQSRGRFPELLNELVNPSEGKLPMLEGGQAAILDPWQQPYQFEVIDGPDGTKRVVVWTDTPEGKRIQWPRE